MKKEVLMKIALFFRFLIAFLFIFSASSKIVDLYSFSLVLLKIFPFLIHYEKYVAVIIILSEYLLGIFLILGLHFKKVILLSTILLLLFITVSIYAHYFGVSAECSCFGNLLKRQLGFEVVIQDILLLLLLLFISKYNNTYVYHSIRYYNNDALIIACVCTLLVSYAFNKYYYTYYGEHDNNILKYTNNMPIYGEYLAEYEFRDSFGNIVKLKKENKNVNVILLNTYINVDTIIAQIKKSMIKYSKPQTTIIYIIRKLPNNLVIDKLNNTLLTRLNSKPICIFDYDDRVSNHFGLPDCKCNATIISDLKGRAVISGVSLPEETVYKSYISLFN